MGYGDALTRFAHAGENDLLRLSSTTTAAVGTAIFTALAMKGHTVRPAHVPVFAGLEPDGTNISTLASRAGISRQAMSGLVRDVESEGYVRTLADPTDRRALIVELTEKGAQFCDDAIAVSATVASSWRDRLGDERYDSMIGSLHIIAGDAD